MSYLKEKLRNDYFTDLSITIVQSGITKIDVYHGVQGFKNLAASYRVILVPVSMSLQALAGFPQGTNININKVLAKLERMKAEAIMFVNSQKKKPSIDRSQKDALAKAAKSLFTQEFSL